MSVIFGHEHDNKRLLAKELKIYPPFQICDKVSAANLVMPAITQLPEHEKVESVSAVLHNRSQIKTGSVFISKPVQQVSSSVYPYSSWSTVPQVVMSQMLLTLLKDAYRLALVFSVENKVLVRMGRQIILF